MTDLTEEQKMIGGFVFLIIMVVVYLLAAPFFTIWSLNQLFHLELDYSFRNYVAVIWMLITLNAIRITKKD